MNHPLLRVNRAEKKGEYVQQEKEPSKDRRPPLGCRAARRGAASPTDYPPLPGHGTERAPALASPLPTRQGWRAPFLGLFLHQFLKVVFLFHHHHHPTPPPHPSPVDFGAPHARSCKREKSHSLTHPSQASTWCSNSLFSSRMGNAGPASRSLAEGSPRLPTEPGRREGREPSRARAASAAGPGASPPPPPPSPLSKRGAFRLRAEKFTHEGFGVESEIKAASPRNTRADAAWF